MAKVSLNNIKTRFESGDRPSGADYVDLIDTLSAQATDLGSDGNNEHIVYGIENKTILETLDAGQWRLVKYLVSISKISDGDNKFFATELSVLIDGENISISEYGLIDSDGDVGTVEVSRSGQLITLSVVPNPLVKPVTAKFARIGLKA